MSDADDDLALSAQAMAALAEFYAEQEKARAALEAAASDKRKCGMNTYMPYRFPFHSLLNVIVNDNAFGLSRGWHTLRMFNYFKLVSLSSFDL